MAAVDADVGHQPMPIVEQDMARVGELRLFGLAGGQRIGIRRGLIGVIAPRFGVEIDRGISGSSGGGCRP